jgi:WD40 repeat protein
MLYIWKTLGGVLLPSSPVKAHYRQVTVLTWTSNGRFLVTGGADGMVHVFSLIDLAEQPPSTTASAKSAPIQPIRTWTKHQLAVTAIASLPSGRMASAAKDGLVVIVEISSGAVLASIRMPCAVTALIYVPENQCLAAGTVKGVICMIDLSDYAVHRTIQTGATVVKRSHRRTSEERVFGSESSSATAGGDGKAVGDGASAPYRVELRGHDRAITSLAVFQADSSDHDDFCQAPQEFLVSGDEAGALRVWDLDSRGCVRVVRPWSSRTSAGAAAGDAKASRSPSARSLHPVTSIRVLQHDEEDTPGVSASSPESMAVSVGSGSMFNGASASRETKRTSNHLANLVTPLRKFPEHQHSSTVLVPFVRRPRRDEETMSFWDVSSNNTFSYERALRKRRRKHELGSSKNNPTQGSESYTPCTEDEVHESQDDKNEEVQRLRKELEEARSTIQRWEAVNNKLIARLQQQA